MIEVKVKAAVVPVVVGVLEAVSRKRLSYCQQKDENINITKVQKAALLGIAHILRTAHIL